MKEIDFKKGGGLVPVIIQEYTKQTVLMLGFMNEEAWEKTLEEKKVTFFSRSKQRLWTKGETSGNFLHLKSYTIDCDNDTILLKVDPIGPVCHTGLDTCFGNSSAKGFINTLEAIIADRIDNQKSDSYTYSLFSKGINKVAQKVGEEAVELVIESKDNNYELFKNEAADLLYHYLILLKAKGMKLEDIEEVLKSRNS
mgnify:CR=1 FL=1